MDRIRVGRSRASTNAVVAGEVKERRRSLDGHVAFAFVRGPCAVVASVDKNGEGSGMALAACSNGARLKRPRIVYFTAASKAETALGASASAVEGMTSYRQTTAGPYEAKT